MSETSFAKANLREYFNVLAAQRVTAAVLIDHVMNAATLAAQLMQ